jgi:RimJ/RimL family protein N-acetyltransferase
MELRTNRLILRSLVAADIDRLVEVADDRRIARNLTSAFPHPYTRDDAVAFVESEPDGLAIVPVEPIESLGPGMVGIVGGNDLGGDGPSVYEGVHSIGYWLHPDAWGHGLATEAATAYLDHIVQTQRPRRFEAGVYGWNPASGRVLEKLGFELEGRHQARIDRFGEVTDELIYGKVL